MGRYDDFLLISDFDRTLTSHQDSIPQANLDAIEYFLSEGGVFTVATGRSVPLFRTRAMSVPHNAPPILFNGAVCYDYQRDLPLFCHEMPSSSRELAQDLVAHYPQLRIEVQNLTGHYPIGAVSDDGYANTQGVCMQRLPIDQIPGPFIKIILVGPFTPTPEYPDFFRGCSAKEEAYYSTIYQELTARYPDYSLVRSAPRIIEINLAGVSKGRAAQELKQSLGRKILVCIGDAPNDLSMLQAADLAFIPANASEPLLKYGFSIADDCDKGAVASVIHSLPSI